jgi:hypothetical protein
MMPDEVKPKAPRGRPRVADPMTSIGTRLPSADYDRLVRAANLQDKSLAALVRQLLTLRLPKV